MLKEKEKRTFWIVVMAVAVVSLVSAWVSSLIVSMDYIIDYAGELGEWADYDFMFSAAVLLFVLFALVVAAVAHLATKGRNCRKARIIWASVIGGFFLLSCIVLTVVAYVVIREYNGYMSLTSYVTAALSMAVSYEIAFLAQCMLNRRPKQTEATEQQDQQQE